MLGAAVGCIPLLLWRKQGSSIQYGITLPGNAGITAAFTGEFITTSLLVIVVFVFVGSKQLRAYTPFAMPVLYCFMVWAETIYSGCSTNPARSFGPALLSSYFNDYWIYAAAPLLAAFVITILFRLFRLHEFLHIKSARLSYHNTASHESIKSGDVMADGKAK